MSIRRRTAGAAFALALAGSTASIIAAAVPASADPGGNPSLQYCRSIADQFPNQNIIGPCTSAFQSNPNAAKGAIVEFACKTQLVPGGQFATVGECVSTVIKTIRP